MSAREQGHAGKPVHPGKQPLVPCGWLHAAGIRDNAQSLVHPMCQRGVVSYECVCVCVPSMSRTQTTPAVSLMLYFKCVIPALLFFLDMCFNSQANFLPGKIVFLVVAFSFSDSDISATVSAPELRLFETTIKKC